MKNVSKKRSKRTNPSLPDDIITEILLRLPAKTLVQLKYACKSWYNLIRSSAFISKHYATHEHNKLSLCCYSPYGGNHISFFLSDIKLELTVSSGDVKLENNAAEIVGTSYGLVCLSLPYIGKRKTNYLLWNPATGDRRRIALEEPRVSYYDWVGSGFYFDYVESTHKVVRLSRKTMLSNETIDCVDIFTVRDNTWKEKELILHEKGIFYKDGVTCIDRCMYWIVESSLSKRYVLCFDMVDELLQKIEFPTPDSLTCYCRLAQYKGSLVMIVHKEYIESFHVWILSDYGGGNKPSWSTKLTLRPPLPSHVYAIIGFYVKGGVDLVVLLMCTRGFVLWNRYSGETTELLDSEKGFLSQVFDYTESLASVV